MTQLYDLQFEDDETGVLTVLATGLSAKEIDYFSQRLLYETDQVTGLESIGHFPHPKIEEARETMKKWGYDVEPSWLYRPNQKHGRS